MLGHVLGVEQFKSTRDQASHQVHERNLRGVSQAVKHALAEKGAAEIDTVESTHEVVVFPDLDAVGVP